MEMNQNTDPFEDPIVETNVSVTRGGRGESSATTKDTATNAEIAQVNFKQTPKRLDLPCRDPVKDSRNWNNGKTPGNRGGGGGKAPLDAGAAVNRYKQALKEDNLAQRTYKKLLTEAIQVIESLQKPKVSPTAVFPIPKFQTASDSNDGSSIAKILQDIKIIKAAVTQIQVPVTVHGKSWAKVASKSHASETIIRIHDEEEKKEISKLTSEELVKKIGRTEVIGARKMVNGQVKVYFTGQETKEQMEINKDWTLKLAATAQVATPTYQVLVHDMPLSFEPGNPEHLKSIQSANELYIMGMKIDRAAWLKKNKNPSKTTGSLIVWFNQAEQADKAISKGIMWGYELKATEIFKSGFRAMQCYNCQRYGHMARNCTANSKCGHCAHEHNTRECPGKQEARCSNCGRKHASWHPSCPIRIAAKARATQNRIQDPGRFIVREAIQDDDWQIVGSRKRRVGTTGTQVVGADGEIIERRGPGRPRGSIKMSNMTKAAAKMSSIHSMLTFTTPEPSRPVTRENQTESSEAPLCTMTQ